MAEKMTVSAYARHRGVSHAAVHQAIARHRLTRSLTKNDKGRTLIDPAIADREWSANSDERKNVNNGAGGRASDGESAPRAAAAEQGEGPQLVGGKTLNEIRGINLALQARHSELDLLERKGKLVDVDKVTSEWFDLVRRVRDRLLLIPSRIDGAAASEQSQLACHKLIRDELLEALVELTNEPLRRR